MSQQLRMDPKVWSRIRMIALERDESATAIVQRVMEAWIEDYDREQRGNPLAAAKPQAKSAPLPSKPIPLLAPWDEEPVGYVTDIIEDETGITIIGEKAPAAKMGAVIVSKDDVAAKVEELNSFRGRPVMAVPKPTTSKKKPRFSSSKESDD